MRKHLRRSRRKLFSLKAWKVRLVFWVGAVLVGCVSAMFAILSLKADLLFQRITTVSHWIPMIMTPLGMVLIVWITRHLVPGSQGSGIPQAIAALESQAKSKLLSIRIATGKIILTLMGLISGASIGRQGPSVHVGASIMYSLGRFAKFPPHYMEKSLILAGAAAGLAAAFNTPLAGIVFAIEEMSRSFEQKNNGIVTTAVVLSGLTAMAILGKYHYFGSSNASIPDLSAWMAVPICGIIGGLLGGMFTSVLMYVTEVAAPIIRNYPYKVALICGAAVALFGYYSGYQTSGTGYLAAKEIIAGTAEFDPMFPINKMGATLASYLSGIPGGLLVPSLATGAGVGADLGHWLPVAPISVMVMLGMVAYFSGVVQTPITAFIIVMEMTDNQEMLLPLMATAFVAFGSSHLVCPRPLYHTLAMAFLDPKK
jgi:chloride channel protein, CIC family